MFYTFWFHSLRRTLCGWRVFFVLIIPLVFRMATYSATSARYVGLGFGGVSVADDLAAVYINPSGIVLMEEDEAGFGVNDALLPYHYGVDYSFYYGGEVKESFARGGRYVASLSVGNRLSAAGDFGLLAGYARNVKFGRYGEFPVGVSLGGANFIDDKNPSGRRVFKPNIMLGIQKRDFPDGWAGGLSVRVTGDKTSAIVGAARKFYYDEYLGVIDLDTDSKIYLGVEKSVWGELARARAGINTRQKALSLGMGAYMWPYAADVYFMLPFDSSDGETIGCSFVYRFGGYNFSQVLLDRNTEKSASLENKIKKSKEELAALKKKLSETETAVKKVKDFVEILDSEAAELIKKKLQMMKAQAEEEKPVSSPIKPKAAVSTEKVKTEEKITFPARYKVVRGDSLRSIASRYYGDANKWQKIYEANPQKIERGLPRVGEELIIPAP